MAKNKTANFDEFWRDAISQWERSSNEFATHSMQSPEFSQAMTNMAIGSAGLQKLFAMMLARSLAHMNLPSRTEILEIAERLRAIEENLAQIQTALAKLTGEENVAAPAKAKPARTKRPLARTPAAPERAK
jgi:anion-transporting  ArsA/GET3 family ATPase